jgi:hypothetical protein
MFGKHNFKCKIGVEKPIIFQNQSYIKLKIQRTDGAPDTWFKVTS